MKPGATARPRASISSLPRCGDARRDGGDAAATDGDVELAAGGAGAVEHGAVADDQIVLGAARPSAGRDGATAAPRSAEPAVVMKVRREVMRAGKGDRVPGDESASDRHRRTTPNSSMREFMPGLIAAVPPLEM